MFSATGYLFFSLLHTCDHNKRNFFFAFWFLCALSLSHCGSSGSLIKPGHLSGSTYPLCLSARTRLAQFQGEMPGPAATTTATTTSTTTTTTHRLLSSSSSLLVWLSDPDTKSSNSSSDSGRCMSRRRIRDFFHPPKVGSCSGVWITSLLPLTPLPFPLAQWVQIPFKRASPARQDVPSSSRQKADFIGDWS